MMYSLPWMLFRLGLETHVHHTAADEDRLAIMNVKTRAEYRAFLVRIYGFEAAVEESLSRVRDLDPEVMRDRHKVDRLRQDLLLLGLTPEVMAWLPTATIAQHVRTPAQALGWLFVLERATLLSGLLRRHVQRTFGEALNGATNYLGAYGEAPGARFRALGEILCRYARRYTPTSIVTAANDAFRAQRQWYLSFGFVSARGSEAGATPVLQLTPPLKPAPPAPPTEEPREDEVAPAAVAANEA